MNSLVDDDPTILITNTNVGDANRYHFSTVGSDEVGRLMTSSLTFTDGLYWSGIPNANDIPMNSPIYLFLTNVIVNRSLR